MLTMRSKPKNAAKENQKSVAAKKDGPKTAVNGADGTKNGRNKKKSGRAGRPKPKTHEEMDADMDVYMGTSNGAAPASGTAEAAAAPEGEDVIM